MNTFCIFIAIIATKGLEYYKIDIKNIFTESGLEKKIYLFVLLGVIIKKGRALRVLRSLYGLKQAARDWNLFIKK
jgi:hypothetical protein